MTCGDNRVGRRGAWGEAHSGAFNLVFLPCPVEAGELETGWVSFWQPGKVNPLQDKPCHSDLIWNESSYYALHRGIKPSQSRPRCRFCNSGCCYCCCYCYYVFL